MATKHIENTQSSSKEPMTWKTLYRADRTIKTPFQIVLKDHNDVLHCEEVIRIVPKKRLLAFGKWGDKDVAVKLFYENRNAKRDADRDAFGVESLMQTNVPTAKLLYKGNIDKGRIHILILEKINDAVSLETLWENKKNIDDIRPLLHAVTIELATQHVLGILQNDLHLRNFLVAEKNIYTLDGGKIDYIEQPLDIQDSIAYLALFLAQLGVGVPHLQQELFDIYANSRGWLVKPAEIKTFHKYLAQQTEDRMRKYKRKIFRPCSAFNRLNKINKTIMYDRQYESSQFQHLLLNPDAYIDDPKALILKAGRSSTIVKVVVDGRELVIKRYNIKNVWHGLRRCLRTTRAKKSWQIAQQLYASGITTPRPVAFIENELLGLHGKSYFIMDYLDGQHLENYFVSHKNDMQACERMAKDSITLLKNLTALRITQGDLKMTNILVANETPYLIDFDGAMEYFSTITLRRAFKNELNRFMKNWENMPHIHALYDRLIQDEMLS